MGLNWHYKNSKGKLKTHGGAACSTLDKVLHCRLGSAKSNYKGQTSYKAMIMGIIKDPNDSALMPLLMSTAKGYRILSDS